MNNTHIKHAILLGGGLLFNYLFWEEDLGINLLLFSLFLTLLTAFFSEKVTKSKPFFVLVCGVIITGISAVYHNSMMAKFTHIISVILMVGFAHQPRLKSVIYSFPTAIAGYFRWPSLLKKIDNEIIPPAFNSKNILRNTKLTLLPLLILVVFYVIFRNANPVFEEITTQAWKRVNIWLTVVFEKFSPLQLLFFLFGLSITGWGLYIENLQYFLNRESNYTDRIERSRKSTRPTNDKKKKMLGLKYEHVSALILLVMVNLLLFIVNVIDVHWIWIDFQYDYSFSLSQFVHEGTYLLILSILLSIGILLYFFRKNQNFFPHKKRLIILSGIWIAQNAILAISVAIRNYHYIHYYGLAYKRIGVIVFLALTLFGLITLFVKISQRKSSYYLLRYNSWSIYIALVIVSLVNWDGIIARYNIIYTIHRGIDVEFLLSLSDKTLPIIDENKDLLFANADWRYNGYDHKYKFKDKVKKFLERKQQTSWCSWNYLEHKTLQYFNHQKQ